MSKLVQPNIGDKIGKCIYLGPLPVPLNTPTSRRKAKFRCTCGQDFVGYFNKIITEEVTSCGCLRLKMLHKALFKHGESNNKTPEFNIWNKMKQRCNNPASKEWVNYGGRGITVCKSWQKSYSSFLRNMGRRPSKRHSLDRIDNDKGYYPSNCRWATKREQSVNKRNNLIIKYKGVSKALVEWTDEFSMPFALVRNRIRKLGWTPAEALTTPIKREKRYLYK
jgi:hypothetical protein